MTDLDFLQAENEKKPVDRPPALISEYVEGRRILPPGTPFPGFWENKRTPYLVEIMDSMSPYSPVIEDDTMKGAQLGVTAAAENVCGYWMDPCPTEVLFASATDALLEKWATKRLEPLIDSLDFRYKIYAQIENTKTRRSGDKIYSKEYVGGALSMVSAQSAAGLRSESKRVLLLDEVDGAPRNLKTGEGNWFDVVLARANAWGHRKKIMAFSTPGTFKDSIILERYGMGDQRKYFVPCPHCHKKQILEFKRLKPDTTRGTLVQAYYICEFCGEALFNHHKTNMLAAGSWQPTAEPTTKTHRSRQISSMYSPVGMLSWTEMYEKYQTAQADPSGEKMRSFTNLYLGEPYRETGSRPKLENVIELRGGYRQGEIQKGTLFLTAFIDVQRGSETDDENPARLELEVCGHGAGFRTWSVLYKRFEGDIEDPYSGAWALLDEWAREGGLVYRRADGRQFNVSLVLVDSGDGVYADVVYRFCDRWEGTFPSKGFQSLKKRKDEDGDPVAPSNFKRYRAAKSEKSLGVVFYEIATNYYKRMVYNNLKIQRKDIGEQRPGFCDFPIDYGEKYFKMLTAEEQRTDGSFHAGARRNEALDCRVGNLCAGDIYLDARVSEARAAAKSKGAKDIELQQVNHRWVLGLMTRQTAGK